MPSPDPKQLAATEKIIKALSPEDRLTFLAQMYLKQEALEKELQWMRDQLAQIMEALQKWEASEDAPPETDSDMDQIFASLDELFDRTDILKDKLNPLLPHAAQISAKNPDVPSLGD